MPGIAFAGAAQLPPGLADRLRDVELQARDAGVGLPAFDAGTHRTDLLETAAAMALENVIEKGRLEEETPQGQDGIGDG